MQTETQQTPVHDVYMHIQTGLDYRPRVKDSESVSTWQSLGFRERNDRSDGHRPRWCIQSRNGLSGVCNIHVAADSEKWLEFLTNEKTTLWSPLTRGIRMRENPNWFLAFGRCFPS
jgi:hypothetical protein